MSTDTVIAAQDLCKTFRDGTQAVHAFDLAVPRGAVYGLLGRNGAGKTTTLRLLMGLLMPTRGTAAMLGQDLWRADRAHRQRVAYVSQESRVHEWMTFDQLADHVAHFYDRWDQARAVALAERFGIARGRALGTLSGGQRRLAAVVMALAARPEVLILDEPAAGLDPLARRGLIDALIEALGEGADATILLSTHICSDLERLASHIGIMDRGRIVAGGALEDLVGKTKRVQIVFGADGVPKDFSIPGARSVQVRGPVWSGVATLPSDDALAGLAARMGARVEIFPLGLEELVIETLGAPIADVQEAARA